MTLLRFIGPMDIESIVRSGAGAPRRDQAVPDIAGAPRQIAAFEFGAAFGIEETYLHPRRIAREQREIDSALAPRGAQGARQARMNDFHCAGAMKNIAASGGKFSRSEYGYPCAPSCAAL